MVKMLNQALLQLPKEWKWFKLDDILTQKPQYGLTSKSTSEQNGIVYIRISDIREDGSLKIDDLRYVKIDKETFKKYELKENDVIIARSGSVGRVYLHKDFGKPCVFASYLIRFNLNQNIILPKFFFYYSFTTFYRNFIAETFKIVAQPNINAKQFSRLLIPLPPLEEQKRIVAKLDEIFSKIEKARKLREEALKDAEQIMQSALNEVFSKAEEKGWKLVKLREIAEVLYGEGLPESKRKEGGKYGVYGSNGLIGRTDKYLIDYPTIIIGRKGTVGAATLVKEKCWAIDTTFYLKLKTNVKLDYLYYALKAFDFTTYIITTTKPGINRSQLENIKLPLPPTGEQEKVAEYLDKLQEKIVLLKKHQEETQKEIEMLTSSVLNKAFIGNL